MPQYLIHAVMGVTFFMVWGLVGNLLIRRKATSPVYLPHRAASRVGIAPHRAAAIDPSISGSFSVVSRQKRAA